MDTTFLNIPASGAGLQTDNFNYKFIIGTKYSTIYQFPVDSSQYSELSEKIKILFPDINIISNSEDLSGQVVSEKVDKQMLTLSNVDKLKSVEVEIKLSKKSLNFLVSTNPFTDDDLKPVVKEMRKQGIASVNILTKIKKHKELSPSQVAMILALEPTEREKQLARQSDMILTLEEMLLKLEGKLLIYQDSTGSESYLWHQSEFVVQPLSFDGLKLKIASVLKDSGTVMLDKNLIQFVKTFLTYTESTSLRTLTYPPSFSTKPNQLCFNYVSLETANIPTPTWDAFIENCGKNGKALMAFTWQIFHPEFEGRQYLLLRSQGATGKGSYTSWLEDYIGRNNVAALSPKDKNWPAMCVGKRLGLFGEVNNTSFVQSSEFKQITGGDSITVTNKYDKSFSTKLDTKFILSTNSSIDVEGRTSESSRCILVDMKNNVKYIPEYKEKLKAEEKGFLFKCQQAFIELYDSKLKKLNYDTSDFENHSATFEDDYTIVFESAFEICEDSKLRSVDFTKAVNVFGKSQGNNKFFRQNFKEWVERKYPQVTMLKSNGHQYYKSLKLNDKAAELLNIIQKQGA